LFFLLSKTLDFVLLPAVWLVALLLGALVAKPGGRARRRWLQAAGLLVLLGTNNALVNEALLAWEKPPVPLGTVAPADAVVLLTGITSGGKSPHDRVYLGHGADRLTHALWLYRSGRARRIIISGGSGAVLPGAVTEAGSTGHAAAASRRASSGHLAGRAQPKYPRERKIHAGTASQKPRNKVAGAGDVGLSPAAGAGVLC
jgi:hypothetical protein